MSKDSDKEDLGKKLQYLAFEYFKAAEAKSPEADRIWKEYQDKRQELIGSE